MKSINLQIIITMKQNIKNYIYNIFPIWLPESLTHIIKLYTCVQKLTISSLCTYLIFPFNTFLMLGIIACVNVYVSLLHSLTSL